MNRLATIFSSILSSPQLLLGFVVIVALLFLSCASTRVESRANQYIRVENQNQSRVRAYIAFETSPTVRVYLGSVEPYETEFFPVPGSVQGHRGLMVRCESGPRGRAPRLSQFFETAYVTLTGPSTLVIRIRDPIRYSDYTIFDLD